MAATADTTVLLRRAAQGDAAAVGALFELLRHELRAIAGRAMRGERRDHTLQPTALVDEAWIRLVRERQVAWENRAHFLSIAARAMREILANHARTRRRLKRGGDRLRVTLTSALKQRAGPAPVDAVALDEALARMEAQYPRPYEVFRLRELGCMTVEDAARWLDLSERTVKGHYQMARAFLRRYFREERVA